MKGPYVEGQRVRVKSEEEIRSLLVGDPNDPNLLPGGMHFYEHMYAKTCGLVGMIVDRDEENPPVRFDGGYMFFMPDETIDPVEEQNS